MAAMRESSRPGASVAAAVTIVPSSDPPAGAAADPAETIRPFVAADHARIAQHITEVAEAVVHRLISAGVTLETALGLMDGHRAADRIQLATDELDQAITDLRNAVFRRAPI